MAHRVFAPSAWSCLLTAAAVASLLSLGWWQVGRAREKQAMVESFAQGTRSSVRLDDDATVDGLPRYQHLTASGRYESAHQVLLDNMPSPRSGSPGYRVLTPLRRAATDRLLLVDRGWVPLGATRDVLPHVAVGDESRIVEGRLDRFPAPGVRVGAAGTAGDEQWPRVLNFPRPDDLERALGAPVESQILLLDQAANDGYEREWRPALGLGAERHLGYAVQWFALALLALVLFVALNLQRTATSPQAHA